MKANNQVSYTLFIRMIFSKLKKLKKDISYLIMKEMRFIQIFLINSKKSLLKVIMQN
jgi:hypothetical protein